MTRPLTERERTLLDFLLAEDFDGAVAARTQAASVTVVATCDCGCPSIDFHDGPHRGMTPVVDAEVLGTNDTLFLFLIGDRLGGIEYVPIDEPTASELPTPSSIRIY